MGAGMAFRSLKNFLLGPIAVLALTGASFHGDRASITFPEGWTLAADKPASAGLFESFEGNSSKTGANCNAQTKDLAPLAKLTLQDINTSLGHVYTLAEWADLLGVEPAQLNVVTSEIRPFADAFFHVGTLRYKADGKDVAVRYGFYVLPGRITMAGCYTPWADYPAYTAMFATTIDSLRPW